jgi:AAA domain, putative AbiEii toxin, Type IV TA system
MERGFQDESELFPKTGRLKQEFRDMLRDSIFFNFKLGIDRLLPQKRLVLYSNRSPLPYMVWSAGQREFVPLLLGFFWLMPQPGATRRENIEWVIIEEIEMGLHPRAVSTALLLVLELIVRGYRVCLSTHSPQVLDMVWAWQTLKANHASPDQLLEIFGAPNTPGLQKLAREALQKTARVYYFSAQRKSKDITSLDPGSVEKIEASWGGLLEFSGRANEAVAKAVARAESERSSARDGVA